MESALSVHPSPLAGPINDFSMSVFTQIARNQPGSNVFLSPLGICTALSMLMLGARSSSEDQLRHGLHFDQLDQEKRSQDVHHLFQKLLQSRFSQDPNFMLSNYILLPKEPDKRNEALAQYRSSLKSLYAAEVDDVDFFADAARIVKQVNDWVNRKTHGLIPKVLYSPPSPGTSLILLNAIYFKGKWKAPFDKRLTMIDEFHNSAGQAVKTEFMCKSEEKMAYLSHKISGHDVHVIELPYNENNASMTILVPHERNALARIIRSKTFETEISSVISSMSKITRSRTKVNLFLPKFKLETEYDLNPILERIGITDIFNDRADLSGINGRKDLSVSYIKHKAIVKVDEEGTEAAAVTSVMVRTLSYSPIIDVRADHPFLFLIRDRTSEVILFVGIVDHF